MWPVITTDEYLEWFENQESKSKSEILASVLLLKEFGPQLGRPYADTLKGSKIKNLKELRVKSYRHVYRIAYYFDEKRNALLLTAGDKKGKNEKQFYKQLISRAEKLIIKYELEEE